MLWFLSLSRKILDDFQMMIFILLKFTNKTNLSLFEHQGHAESSPAWIQFFSASPLAISANENEKAEKKRITDTPTVARSITFMSEQHPLEQVYWILSTTTSLNKLSSSSCLVAAREAPTMAMAIKNRNKNNRATAYHRSFEIDNEVCVVVKCIKKYSFWFFVLDYLILRVIVLIITLPHIFVLFFLSFLCFVLYSRGGTWGS